MIRYSIARGKIIEIPTGKLLPQLDIIKNHFEKHNTQFIITMHFNLKTDNGEVRTSLVTSLNVSKEMIEKHFFFQFFAT